MILILASSGMKFLVRASTCVSIPEELICRRAAPLVKHLHTMGTSAEHVTPSVVRESPRGIWGLIIHNIHFSLEIEESYYRLEDLEMLHSDKYFSEF